MMSRAFKAWRNTKGAGRREIFMGITTIAAGFAIYLKNVDNNGPFYKKFLVTEDIPRYAPDTKSIKPIPIRAENLERLKEADTIWDLLIIGGGATGAGCALDAALRGLKVAAVEREDFSSGTSSKSTKLVHGGVRYLEKAVWNLDYEQYKLVREALHERATFVHIAPHLSSFLPIMIPIYKWWQVPYFYVGTKAYDFLAGAQNLTPSYFLGKKKALEKFPMLRAENLKGALVYYDGQHNDARMNIALMMTAALNGAAIANRVEVISLLKNQENQIRGAKLRDTINGEEWNIRAKCVINATGPFTDSIRKMDEPDTRDIVVPSSGVHVILPGYYSPKDMGLIDPNTSDGRVIFFLPFLNRTMAGTTDTPCKVEKDPLPKEEEVTFILNEVKKYLSDDICVRRQDVLATWSGIRPLVYDPEAKNTESLVRNHMINVSKSGLLTIAGGKWTTYREMAEETIDLAIKQFNLTPKNPQCTTKNVKLIGSEEYRPMLYFSLIQQFGFDETVAKNLCDSYGTRAWLVAQIIESTEARPREFVRRLDSNYPFLEAEVVYCTRHEYANTAVDILGRRTRLAFLDCAAALHALPRVIDLMAEELGWDKIRKQEEWENGVQYLLSMGLPASKARITRSQIEFGAPIKITQDDYQLYSDQSIRPELTTE